MAKVKYGIYAFDFQYPQLKWIVKELKASIQEKIRDNIVVIDMVELGEFKDISTTFNSLRKVLNEKIQNSSKTVGKTTDNKTKISALEFWKSKIPSKPNKTESKPNKKTPQNKPNKGGTAPTKRECSIQNVKYKTEVAKIISHLRNKKTFTVTDKIEDGPEYGIDVYIVLLGFPGVEIYFNLLQNKFNLLAIIYFYNEWEDLNIENARVALHSSDLTKNINLSTQYVPLLSKFMANKHKNTIFTEFCHYLYDLEFKRVEYQNYLDSLDEYNVEENSYPNSVFQAIEKLQIPNKAPDEIIVLIYLNTLLNLSSENSIENDDMDENDTNIENFVYFLKKNDQTSIFIHNDNHLMKLIYASQMGDYNYENLLNFAQTVSLAYNVELISNSITFLPSSNTDISPFGTEECFYEQKFSTDVFFQKVEALLCDFDKITYSIMEMNIAIFGQSKEGLTINCERIYVIPNKICFRDFCYYFAKKMHEPLLNINMDSEVIIPNSENIKIKFSISGSFIRVMALKNQFMEQYIISKEINDTNKLDHEESIKSSELNQRITVYNLGDKQLQISFYEYCYRSEYISVIYNTDKWIDGRIYMRIKTKVFENFIFYNRQILGQRNNAIRILTKSGISIDLSYQPDNTDCCEIFVTWPNKLYIKAIYYYEFILKLEQNSINKYNKEEKREFTDDGSILLYYENNLVTIIRPNGTIYCTSTVRKSLQVDCTQPSYLDDLYTKYSNEIDYIKKFDDILDSKNYSITTADGTNFEIENNIIKQKFRNFLVNEWIDFLNDSIYIHREDDVKLVYKKEYLECNYPDGTVVKSYLIPTILFNFDTEEEEDREESESYQIISTILDVLFDYVLGIGFTTCELLYNMQHINYAQIELSNEKSLIKSPDKVNIILSNENTNIVLEDNISIIFNKNICTIQSTEFIKDICNFKINLNFNETVDEPVFNLEENDQIFQISQDYTCQLLPNRGPKDDEGENVKKSKILNFTSYGGNERVTKDEVIFQFEQQYPKVKPHIYNNEQDDFLCLIVPWHKYEDIFKMTVDNVENLKQFEKYYFIFNLDEIDNICPPIFICRTNEAKKLTKHCSPVYTFSIVLKKCTYISVPENYKQYAKIEDVEEEDEDVKLSRRCTDISSMKSENNKQDNEKEEDIDFIDFQNILESTVDHLELQCELNGQKMITAKKNALESKLMHCNIQKFGIQLLQKLVLCNVYPQYFDFIGNDDSPEKDNDLVEFYLKNKI